VSSLTGSAGGLPPTPSPALPLRATAVLLVAVLSLLLLSCRPSEGQAAQGLQLISAVVAVGATWRVLLWRARRSTAEQVVWRLFATGCFLYGLGALTTVAVASTPALAGLVDVPAAVCAVVTFPLAYRALVRWSRHSTGVDPDDLLNGTSSVLVIATALTALLARHEPPRAGQLLLSSLSWTTQLLAVQNAAVVVLVIAALAAGFTGRLHRDPRLWLVTTAYVLAGAGPFAALLSGGARAGWAVPVWSLGLLALSTAALLPPRFVPTESSDPVKSTIGSFVVVLAGLGVIAVVVLRGAPAVLTLVGLLAVLGSSVRLLVNLRELIQLAVTRREALTDDLTGVANRRAVLRRLQDAIAAGRATRLLVFDLDHFKEVNDGLGHGAGDELLRMVVRRLGPELPPAALLGRLGGDEFAIVVDGPGPSSPRSGSSPE
jgi:hypothetical protein